VRHRDRLREVALGQVGACRGRVGATRADLVKYATSGDVSGDRQMVVGYAGIVVS